MKITGLNAAPVVFPKTKAQMQPYKQDIQRQNVQSFTALLEFQGHYREPNVQLTVPMNKLIEQRSIEFELVYHVKSGRFEQIKMTKGDDAKVALGNAEFVAVQKKAEEVK